MGGVGKGGCVNLAFLCERVRPMRLVSFAFPPTCRIKFTRSYLRTLEIKLKEAVFFFVGGNVYFKSLAPFKEAVVCVL